MKHQVFGSPTNSRQLAVINCLTKAARTLFSLSNIIYQIAMVKAQKTFHIKVPAEGSMNKNEQFFSCPKVAFSTRNGGIR